jgi:hypothetical protein
MTAYFQAGIDTDLLGGPIGFTLTETGGGGATGAVSVEGTFFHVSEFGSLDDGYFVLFTDLTNALNAVGNATYNVSFSQTTGKYTISASGGGVTSFALTSWTSIARSVLGWPTASPSGALTYTSEQRADHYIIGDAGGVSEFGKPYEIDNDLLEELIGDDGTPAIFGKSGAAKGFDLEVPWEPAAAVWRSDAGGLWCWEDWFPVVRTGVPFVVQVTGFPGFVALARKDRCAFRPKLLGDDYLGHATIRISGFYLGEEA